MGQALRVAAVTVVLSAALAGAAHARELSFDDRVRAQEAIERAYYSHQIGATKPFEEAVPRAVLERRVVTYLKQSAALDELWHTRVTSEMLERELARMVRGTQMPERLQELFAALGDDPVLVLECLVRPVLVDRLALSFYAFDERFHAAARHEAESLHDALTSGTLDPSQEHPRRSEIEGDRLPRLSGEVQAVEEERDALHIRIVLDESDARVRVAAYVVPKTPWDEWWEATSPGLDEASVRTVARSDVSLPGGIGGAPGRGPSCGADSWDNGSLDDVPDPRSSHTVIWTGSEMVVWGGISSHELNTGGRYDPATDTWSPVTTAGAPSARTDHTAVWTGSEMVVWGGRVGSSSTDTGGRYDPSTDTWTPMSTAGAPAGRYDHTAIWNESEMVVWGGMSSVRENTGGRYDPSTDTWTPVSTTSAPTARTSHTSVWTGSLMVVWGGDTDGGVTDTGGRYDPATDTWTPTSTVAAPSARDEHTVVWTGSLMVVWGNSLNTTGGRYDPATDTWTSTSTANAPTRRVNHTAVWTGSLMVVWGGTTVGGFTNTGGRYDPATNSWNPTPTSTVAAPTARDQHTAVWTGNLMVVFGGGAGFAVFPTTGGRYDPATNTWTPTSVATGPSMREDQTAVWTGNLMMVWGGYGNGTYLSTGGRYDPTTDSWTPVSTAGAPQGRRSHTAVWTGNVMVVWGGRGAFGSGGVPNAALFTGGIYNPVFQLWGSTSLVGAPGARANHEAVWTGVFMLVLGGTAGGGGRYNPANDQWTPMSTPPSGIHSAVWTGSEMLAWGGSAGFSFTGGRYDPVANLWSSMATLGAPTGRSGSTTVWTGSEMVVWGGYQDTVGHVNTGARYNPATSVWTPTSAAGAPASRHLHSAIWTGEGMLVWGGDGPAGPGTIGGSYDPASDTWTAMSTDDDPGRRWGHSAVWTGSTMLVWGGHVHTTGGHYSPSAPDQDCDGTRDTLDCAPADGGAFAPPAEVTGVFFSDADTMVWSSAVPLAGSDTVHDIVQGLLGEFPVGAGASETCAAPGTSDAFLDDATTPDADAGFWYLIRGRNVCAAGTYGTGSGGERVTGACLP